jgi:hypothetical protein
MSTTTIKPGQIAATLIHDPSVESYADWFERNFGDEQRRCEAAYRARLEATELRAGLPYARLFIDQPRPARYGCSAVATDDDKLVIFADTQLSAELAVQHIDFIAAQCGITRPEYSVRLR